MKTVLIWSVRIPHWGIAETKIRGWDNGGIYEIDKWNKNGREIFSEVLKLPNVTLKNLKNSVVARTH